MVIETLAFAVTVQLAPDGQSHSACGPHIVWVWGPCSSVKAPWETSVWKVTKTCMKGTLLGYSIRKG